MKTPATPASPRFDGGGGAHSPSSSSVAGKTIVITGASSGIGAASARALSRAGATVVLAVRDVEKGRRVARTFDGAALVRHLDLEDLSSVRAFAAAWTDPIDILINNAGIMLVPLARTVDGFERQIGTNHLGHFALTNLLLPRITDRVVTVASDAHRRGSIDLGDLQWERRPYVSAQAYSDSKLANLVFIMELQRRLTVSGSRVRAIAVHPGMVRTSLFDHAHGVEAALIKIIGSLFLVDPEQGARTTVFAATADVPGGSFVAPDGIRNVRGAPKITSAAETAYDEAVGRDLWALSTALTGVGG